MNALMRDDNRMAQLEGLRDNYLFSFSISDISKELPKINFKKIKLSKAQRYDDLLKVKNITKFYLDEALQEIDLPIKREVSELNYTRENINPLRKKIEYDENIIEIPSPEISKAEDLVSDISVPIQEFKQSFDLKTEIPEQELESQQPKLEEEKNVTFNLEAQVVQGPENIIYSPSTVSLPPFEEGVVSSSGEQQSIVWPPVLQKGTIKRKKNTKFQNKLKRKKKRLSKKSKSYYLGSSKEQKDIKPIFPWAASPDQSIELDDIFGSGLEAELVDLPKDKPEPRVETVTIKAFKPKIQEDVSDELMKNTSQKFDNIQSAGISNSSDKVKGVSGKAEKMFDKSGKTKISPVRIMIFGGATATIGYLLWNQFFGNLINYNYNDQEKEQVVVRDLFKRKQVLKNKLDLKKEVGYETTKELNEKLISPITEEERNLLIQKARESLEGRQDPFGQELPLPATGSGIAGEKEDKTPKEIPVQRKQIELVGVISAQGKNLALVNVYVADYSVLPADDKKIREDKLKAALGMAVPNRIEVSILDPVEDWNVRVISKSKSRSDDPTIELVKGEKKFKLKVGQKVLLPEDKPLPEPEVDEESSETESVKQ